MAIGTLAELLRAGQIDVVRFPTHDDGPLPVEGRFRDYLKSSPAPWLQEHRPDRERDLTYSLTPEGAARWEGFFQPDWSRFWEENPDYSEDMTTVRNRYECGSYETRIRALGRCVEWQEIDLAFGLRDIELTEVAPWQATYWKTLPRGYFATVTYRARSPEWDDPRPSESREQGRACNRACEWRRSIDRTT